ncbi:MAG: hypothetical protein PHD74_08895, partial [Candidatus Krumholzibacteria bacterium]|nr:hypothetical protein [Candidatus Krumholzibacteria bacterium]
MTKITSKGVTSRILIRAALIAIVVSLGAAAALRADGTGAAGASFLSLPVGAQSIALGEASAALMHDPFAWLSNPGLLSLSQEAGAGAFHSQWALETYYDNAMVRRPISKLFSIG